MVRPRVEACLPRTDGVPTIPPERAVHPRVAWKTVTGDEPPTYADRSTIGPDGPTRLEAWRAVVRPIEPAIVRVAHSATSATRDTASSR